MNLLAMGLEADGQLSGWTGWVGWVVELGLITLLATLVIVVVLAGLHRFIERRTGNPLAPGPKVALIVVVTGVVLLILYIVRVSH